MLLRPLFALGMLALLATPVAAQIADYAVKDDLAGSFVNLNFAPIRPLVQTDDGVLYALNSHRGTIEAFVTGQQAPVAVYSAPHGPVAIASNIDGALDELLVACRGTSALVRMDRATGRVTAIVKLPAEPGDLVIDKVRQKAYVSCSGANAVACVTLSNNKVNLADLATTNGVFRCLNPLFLSLDSQGRVLVAPLLSGNNTVAQRLGGGAALAAGASVIDLGDPTYADVANGGGLPDQDLFRLDFNLPSSIGVEVVAKNVGTVLFGNGLRTANSFWQLNTEGLNADPNKQTEPSVNGEFATNRLTILDLTSPLPIVVPDPGTGPGAPIDLDRLTVGSGPIDPTRTCGQPYALAFEAATGKGFVAGLLTDNVLALDANGGFSHEFDLPDGSIPRGLFFSRDGTTLYVHCWGTNEVRAYTPSGTFVESFAFSFDPTPPDVKAGRTLFYDAGKSRDNNLSCATCHVEGGTDMLAWNLSAGEPDDKGPMLTQTLRGIAKAQPLHWRGERPGLIDFNPAFEGLLGGAELPAAEFADFEAFVFSLATRANPFQDRRRVLNADIDPPRTVQSGGAANAVQGQFEWFNTITFADQTCNGCHMMPSGTNNDIFHDATGLPKPKRNHFKMAPFQELWRRHFLPYVDAKIWKDPADHLQGYELEPRSFIGAGTSHAGLVKDLLTFVGAVGLVSQTPQLHDDLTAFVLQHDQTTAPVVHEGGLLDHTTAIGFGPELTTYLEPQAVARNGDLVVFGVARSAVLPGNPVVPRRWYFDRDSGANGEYLCDDPAEPPRLLIDFLANVANEWNSFTCVPVGMGEATAIDADLDGLRDAVDPLPFSPFIDPADSQAPTILGGLSPPQWISAKAAKFAFTTSEPARWQIDVVENGVPLPSIATQDFAREHTALLTHLKPSTVAGQVSVPQKTMSYDATVTVIDRRNNRTTYQKTFTTTDFVIHPNFEEHVVTSLEWLDQEVIWDITSQPPVAKLQARAKLTTAFKQGGPPHVPAPARVVIFRVLKNGQPYANWVPKSNRTNKTDVIQVWGAGGVELFDEEGPLMIAGGTDGTGTAFVKFDVFGLSGGDVVTLNVELVLQQSTDTAIVGAYGQDLLSTTAGITTGNPGPDYDSDGDLIPDLYRVFVPVPGATLPVNVNGTSPPVRRFGQWSFPDNPPAARALDKGI